MAAQPQRAPAQQHLAPDGAQPGDAERLAVQAVGLAILALLPASRAQRGHRVGQPSIQRQHQADGQLGHRDGVLARAVGHEHAARAGRLDVDGVDPGARAHHKLQGIRALEHRRADLLAAHDQDADPGHGVRQRVLADAGLGHHLQPGQRPQRLQRLVLQLVRDEQLHGPEGTLAACRRLPRPCPHHEWPPALGSRPLRPQRPLRGRPRPARARAAGSAAQRAHPRSRLWRRRADAHPGGARLQGRRGRLQPGADRRRPGAGPRRPRDGRRGAELRRRVRRRVLQRRAALDARRRPRAGRRRARCAPAVASSPSAAATAAWRPSTAR